MALRGRAREALHGQAEAFWTAIQNAQFLRGLHRSTSLWPTWHPLPLRCHSRGLTGSKIDVRYLTARGRKVVKLKDIAEVKIGLQSGNNPKFYELPPA